MKRLARRYVWWPRMDQDIERMVKNRSNCQETRHKPPSATLHPRDWPQKPWQRVHADYTGPFLGKMFLILVANGLTFMWLTLVPLKLQLRR